MDNLTETIIQCLYECYLCFPACIFFFYINIGKPKKEAVIVYLLLPILIICVYIFINRIWSSICICAIDVLFAMFGFKDYKIGYRFFIGIVGLICLIISDLLCGSLLMTLNIFQYAIMFKYKLFFLIIEMLVFMILAIITSFITKNKRDHNVNLAMLLFPISEFILIYILNCIIRDYKIVIENPVIFFLFILVIIFNIIANMVILKISSELNTKKLLEQKLIFMEYNEKVSVNYQKSVENNLKEIRKIKHDFNNSIQVVKNLINNNDIETASQLMTELEQKYQSNDVFKYSYNSIVDAILNQANKDCINQNIEFKAECSISPDISISKIDICNLLTNIIQNAIHAVNEIKSSDVPKKIHFSAWQDNSMVFFKVKNTKVNNINIKNNKILTTNKNAENHGFGIDIIEHIALTYNGNVIIDFTENEFIIIVQLNIV